MKQKRNLKDETDLKNSFEKNSQQYISNCERLTAAYTGCPKS